MIVVLASNYSIHSSMFHIYANISTAQLTALENSTAQYTYKPHLLFIACGLHVLHILGELKNTHTQTNTQSTAELHTRLWNVDISTFVSLLYTFVIVCILKLFIVTGK